MTESKGHTELPWSMSDAYPFMLEKKVSGLADGYDSYVIAEVKKHSLISFEEALANLDFIVTAVNTYPAVEGLVKALELATGALQILPDSERDIIKFTGKWEHYGSLRVADILDRANTALSRFRSVEGGAE